MNNDESMNCPPQFRNLFVARATFTGPLVVDVMMVGDLLDDNREALETREELAARLLPGEFVAAYAILGFYETSEQASAALDWVREWRAGGDGLGLRSRAGMVTGRG